MLNLNVLGWVLSELGSLGNQGSLRFRPLALVRLPNTPLVPFRLRRTKKQNSIASRVRIFSLPDALRSLCGSQQGAPAVCASLCLSMRYAC